VRENKPFRRGSGPASPSRRCGSRAAYLLALTALALGGCGLAAGHGPTAVRLLVTDNFGGRVLQRAGGLDVGARGTVMSLLMRNDPVRTRPGGTSVAGIDGISSGLEKGEPVDWYYYVNGIRADENAAVTKLHPRDHIWWDRHSSRAGAGSAVVGSFPEPFLNGLGGKRWPVRVECAQATGPACRKVVDRLRSAGVPAAVAALGAGSGAETLTVIVAPWPQISGYPAAVSVGGGPHVSGVYAQFSGDGRTLTLLDPAGRPTRTLVGDAGLIAATRHGTDAPVWVVTGTDEAGVELAAGAFDEAALLHRFALAVSATGTQSLPDASGG
jgi:hypothetical protein